HTLDNLLKQNTSLVGFALANINGHLLASSSNIDINKMPNLKQTEDSRETFIKALENQKMVLGKIYFLEALNSWVIPLRKAIRDADKQLTGVMIAGIKPKNLLPGLNKLNSEQGIEQYQAMLVHDNSFNYAYISGIPDTNLVREIIKKPISKQLIESHQKALLQQLGITMADIKNSLEPVEYFAPSRDGEIKMYSMSYLPGYQLWSITFVPRSRLIDQLTISAIQYLISFIFVFGIIYFLFRYINQFEQANRQQLLNQTNHDFLTGLNNQLYLKYTEPKWIHNNAEPFSILFMDLDNFKNINDSYGHSYGDIILKQVALRLLSIFSDKSLVCRQGGDEFIILCRKTDKKSLIDTANRLLKAISRPYEIDHYQFTIGASIGICRYPQDGDSFDSLFSAADTAMYRAKSSQNNFFIFTNELKEQILRTSQIEQALHTALQKNELHMMYQPQIASKGALYGVEALIRWNNAELG
ncbi:MAG: diguanylate cyclase, partial [Gammaproteobacteria bacterium]|nr:diguanylate cyclase [Gammaproteobacteria bacterium]